MGNIAAAKESSAMNEQLRNERSQLAAKLQAATQAQSKADSAQKAAEQRRDAAELELKRVQAGLSVKEVEAKTWKTKLETNTKAIQQLRLDKKGCETKLENEKKIVKLWQQKHAVKEREATTHLEQKSKAQAEKSKLQVEKTKGILIA